MYLLLLAAWFLLIGVFGPALISLDDTFAVVFGTVLLTTSAYATYRIVRHDLTSRKNKENNK